MKLKVIFLSCCFCCSLVAQAQSDQEAILQVINQFNEGTIYNYADQIEEAFYPESDMYLYNNADTVLIMSPKEYADLYRKKTPGTKNNRSAQVLGIDIVHDVATAKIAVTIGDDGFTLYDVLLLKRIGGQWKIVGKATSAAPVKTSFQSYPVKKKSSAMA